MGTIGAIISSIYALATKLLPGTSSYEGHTIEKELNKLVNTLERIKATLDDAEEREIRDKSVKLWLKELKQVAYAAEDVLDEYQYEILRAQVEARGDSAESPHKKKKLELPDDLTDRIMETISQFDEIAKDRLALQLREEDGPRRCNNIMQITPTCHMVVESNIFGRKKEKEKLINLLCSDSNNSDVVSVVTIVGTGGLGKTTVAQLVYNDTRIRKKFDIFGWICVSEDFNVQKMTKEVMESITEEYWDVQNHSVLRANLKDKIKEKMVFLVLDDVWNENRSDWELFKIPLLSAKLVKILVTTRNEPVARIMQTVPSFYLDYLSEERCWQLFQHYAFGGVNCNEEWKLKIGKLIMRKCGMLPLAVKSIASLLRHEADEDSWREILENDLWELESTKDIFPPLQISYSRLPSHLKSCFLYCSMFPKDYGYDIEELILLWFAQGYIKLKGRKTVEEIGQDYVKQLFDRSFFDYNSLIQSSWFKLHDMVHDLALLNSGNESIEYGKHQIFSKQIYHLYVHNSFELTIPFPSRCLGALRTLIMRHNVENFTTISDLSEIGTLRAVVLEHDCCGFEFLNSIGNKKHLRYISLKEFTFEKLPELICSLYNLQTLDLSSCRKLIGLPIGIGNLSSLQFLHLSYCLFRTFPESFCNLKSLKTLKISNCEFVELPEYIGNLTTLEELALDSSSNIMLPVSICQIKSLRKLKIDWCRRLKELPREMGCLTNLRTLIIRNSGVTYLPPSLNKLTGIRTQRLVLHATMGNNHDQIGWLNDIVDLKGELCFSQLINASRLADAQHTILINKHNLKCLRLYWFGNGYEQYKCQSELVLIIMRGGNDRSQAYGYETVLLESLQPHPNLQKLEIGYYRGILFPKWVGDSSSCASLESILLIACENLTFLPFGNLHNLKHLKIDACNGLQLIQAEYLPSQLQELIIHRCHGLISAPGIENLKCLIKLDIFKCPRLKWLLMEPAPPAMTTDATNYFIQESSMRLQNLTTLRSLEISKCERLDVMSDELLPVESCIVRVHECPKLREWCVRHNFKYEEGEMLVEVEREEDWRKDF